MHPDVVSDTPGSCPKCGMQLVRAGASETARQTHGGGLGVLTWRDYVPLIVIISLIFIVSAVLSWNDAQVGRFSIFQSIAYFMAGFFIVFAGFKLMDIKGFAQGYSTYDILAQKVFSYGYVYPFIELGFGLAMVAGIQNQQLLWSEVLVMGFSGLGVARKLMKREPIQCVCLGTFLKVPLTNITLIEDFGMAILALMLLLAQ
ncbi:MAG: hypothetical protein Greene071421_233 [Parcubacteria group bacterium Greene0714_21]|nr:MAG: hypothetical protein Greene101447_445 [Parcubacteria group bacterium Greene1014_47]TSD04397.1 MAG: hypothetical protein Greene071421_233 [Parcubacteria group bacterium Greene0714_21]